MSGEKPGAQSWRGERLTVKVLYSRAGVAQHIWISGEDGAILVDAGDGVLRDLLSERLDPGRLRGVVFTHGHFDHMGGLHSLLGYLRMIGREETLCIVAPAGCAEVFSAVDDFAAYYSDTIPFTISCRQIQPADSFRLAGMSIKAYSVIHCGSTRAGGILDPIPALGYRVSYKGETVAISGDSGDCPSLRKLVAGADLAVLEATYGSSTQVDREVLEKVHLSEDLAREIGGLAKDFILVHKAMGP